MEGRHHVSLPMLRVCAWCRRVELGDWWLGELFARFFVLLGMGASHTICPTCFARHARGVSYPAALR
jgi:hypothetical protein